MIIPKNKSPVRIVCVGANHEAHEVLKGLMAKDANVVGLVTLPSAHAQHVCDYVDLHPFCNEHGIQTVDTRDVNAPQTLDAIEELQPDYIYTLGWSQLFRKAFICLPKFYVVGSHPSLLPAGRGRAPVPWTILQGHEESAVTLFRIDVGVDSGPILCQKRFAIPERAYAEDVYSRVAANLRDAFVELYAAHAEGMTVEGVEQDPGNATYRAKRTPADGHIDFHRPAKEVATLIRAVSRPFPGAYAYYRDEKVTIWRCDTDNVPPYEGTIGQILMQRGGWLLVQTADHPIWIGDLETEGQPIESRQLRVGSKFGFAVHDELSRLHDEIKQLRKEIAALKCGGEIWRKAA